MGKVIFCLFLILASGRTVLAQEKAESTAATVADAKGVLDLSGNPVIQAVGEARTNVALQAFKATGNAIEVTRQIDGALTKLGLKQLEGSSITEAYSSVTYQKSGFTFTLTVMPTDEPKVVMVTLLNLGNIRINELPKPSGLQEIYSLPSSAMFATDLSVEEAKQQCRQLLERSGWQWFGDTTVSFFMRQNAIRLQVMCTVSPAQQGKTAIQFSVEQMSSALPTLRELARISYSDDTMNLEGDSKLSLEDFEAAYRKLLESEGWKPTTDHPVKIDFREHLIFRNQAMDLAELRFSTVEEFTRFELKFATAAQVEKEDGLARQMAASAKQNADAEKARMDNPPEILIDQPESATPTDATRQSVEFSVASGTAKAVVAKWLEVQKASGWKSDSNIDTKEIGEFTLTKGEQTLSLSFVDPGFIPGEITIRTSKEFQLRIKK